jgi:hypothetical protein
MQKNTVVVMLGNLTLDTSLHAQYGCNLVQILENSTWEAPEGRFWSKEQGFRVTHDSYHASESRESRLWLVYIFVISAENTSEFVTICQ